MRRPEVPAPALEMVRWNCSEKRRCSSAQTSEPTGERQGPQTTAHMPATSSRAHPGQRGRSQAPVGLALSLGAMKMSGDTSHRVWEAASAT